MAHKKQKTFRGYAIQTSKGYRVISIFGEEIHPLAQIPKGYCKVSISYSQWETLNKLLGPREAYSSLEELCA